MELDLMRLLHGELPEERARELRARMERDPALEEEYRRLQERWEGLALPPTAPVPPGFTQRVAARTRADQSAPTPGWVRAAAALALILGTAVGVGVGGAWPLRETAQEVRTVDEEEPSAVDGSLAESYLTTLEDLEP
jgi:anti-sigma factor RsiW